MQRRSPRVSSISCCGSIERHDHFVVMDDAKLAADQFIAQVRINTARIEQIHAIAQFIPLSLNGLKFTLGAMELTRVVAPRQNAVRAKHDITREEKKKKHRNRRTECRKQ